MTAVAQQTPTSTWQLDKVHSSVDFAVKHMVVSTFRGTFDDYDASLSFEDGEPQLTGTAKVASVNVADENLKAHLQSPDFFDAERHPEIRFVSKAIERLDGDRVRIEAELTVKGHTEQVLAEGTLSYIEADMGGGERWGTELETIVDRTKFGLNWNQPLPKGGFAVANDVRLTAHFEFVPGS